MKVQITGFGLASDPNGESQDAWSAEIWNDAVIAVVADGAGRAECAREAAQRIVAGTINNFKARPRTWSLQKALEEFTRLSNRTLYQESVARFDRVEMVSTAVVVALEGDHLAGLNAGDSRAYCWHEGTLHRLSLDHVESDPNLQHVLTQALGLAADLRPHLFQHRIAAGDMILLCTDGVTNLLSDVELADMLAHGAQARTIVQAARERATPETLDDASAIVIQVQDTSHPGQVHLDIPHTLRAGQVVDGCTLVRPFGGNDRTWIVERQGQKAVLKFAPPEARDSEAIRNQFVKEIWSVTRLQADFFTRAFIPEDNHVLCYGMEYVESPNLKQFLRAGPLVVDTAVDLLKFLLDASQFLLRFDLVHGDLKPENILVMKSGEELRFKLIDFGSIGEIFSVTSRAGTPSYLAPERFHAAPCSERTEIFSLGVILHEALTGTYPYGEIEPFQTPVFRAARPPAALNTNIPPWLEAVVLRAIAVKPEERYDNFSEMKFDLEHPAKVQPFFRRDTPLLERDPLLFFKIAFLISAALNVALALWLLAK